MESPKWCQQYDEIVAVLVNTRVNSRIDRKTLAANLGVSRQTVAGWESRRRTPTLPMLCLWASKLDCDLVVISSFRPTNGLRA